MSSPRERSASATSVSPTWSDELNLPRIRSPGQFSLETRLKTTDADTGTVEHLAELCHRGTLALCHVFEGGIDVGFGDFESVKLGLGDLDAIVDQRVDDFLRGTGFRSIDAINLLRCAISSSVIGRPLTTTTTWAFAGRKGTSEAATTVAAASRITIVFDFNIAMPVP